MRRSRCPRPRNGFDPLALLVHDRDAVLLGRGELIRCEIGLEDHELVHRWPGVLDIECHLAAARRGFTEVDLEVGEGSINALSSSAATAQPECQRDRGCCQGAAATQPWPYVRSGPRSPAASAASRMAWMSSSVMVWTWMLGRAGPG